jgi:hypothetical protein
LPAACLAGKGLKTKIATFSSWRARGAKIFATSMESKSYTQLLAEARDKVDVLFFFFTFPSPA